MKTTKPVLLIVMGVSGCGKSTVAQALAERLGYTYFDADDFHSQENKSHMASGKALTDAMRLPWVHTMRTFFSQKAKEGRPCTLAFSGLKKAHRDILRQTEMCTRFIFLEGSQELIAGRLAKRESHFMPQSLLDSQFKSLENPKNEPDVLCLDINRSLQVILDSILSASGI